MRFRRLICLMTLLSFIPLAAGCSSQKVIPLHSDPGSGADPLREGKSLSISGYTSHEDGYQMWRGTIRTAPPDSLLLRKKAASTSREAATLQLARAEVISVSVTDMHWGRSTFLALGLFVGVSVLLGILSDPSYYGL